MTETKRTYAGVEYTVKEEHTTNDAGGSRGTYEHNGQTYTNEADVLKSIDAEKGIDRRGVPQQDDQQ